MNKRFLSKFISIIVSVLIAFSALTGCNSAAEPPVDPPTDPPTTADYLVEGATSEYDIVIASDASDLIKTASIELQALFAEATGITLDIITDSGLTHSAENTYLSIGKNALSQSAQISALKSEVKTEGFKIKTLDKTIYMLGATDRGTLNSVYEYLALEFNFDHFFTNVYDIDKNVTDKALTVYDVVEIPDIDQMTVPSTGLLQYNPENANRMRVIPISEWSIPQNTYNNVHNIMQILPPSRFLNQAENPDDYHPAWYEDSASYPDNVNLTCFSAHTSLENILNPYSDLENPTEYDLMLNEFLEVIKKGVKKSDAEIFPISQRDNVNFCNCDYCAQAVEEYGANSSLLVLLCNNLSNEMAKWFETAEGAPYKRDLKILFFAYQYTESAPVTYNQQTKSYQPSAPEMVCNDNVGVYIAPLGIYSTYNLDYASNQTFKDMVLSWRVLTNNFAFWIYDVNFNNYFYPYDSMVIRQELYKFIAETNVLVLNDQGQTQNIGSCTAWDNLKSYLETKLRWDVNADLTALTKRFFSVCYKTAADTMYSLYLQMRSYTNDIKVRIEDGEIPVGTGTIGHIFGGIQNAVLWKNTEMENWCTQYVQAFSDLDKIKESDPEGYANAYKMVCAEAASPLAILLDLYQDEDVYSDDQITAMKATFKKYCTDGGINWYYDSTSTGAIENLYAAWGIK